VLRAAREVLKRRGEVDSLAEMHSLVLDRLRKESAEYRLSKARLLKVLALSPGVRIKVEKRKTKRNPRLCHLCGSEMDDLYGRDLFGNRVKLGKRCGRCGYRIERGNLEPRRYMFYI
jgi:hypothetical protein